MPTEPNSIDHVASRPLEKPVKTLSEDHGHAPDDNALMGSVAIRLRNADWSKYERGTDAFLDVDRDLKQLAKESPLKAAEIWAENAPKGLKAPDYITESVEQLQTPLEAGKSAREKADGDKEYELPSSLKKRYLQADGKFHFRETQNKIAFEDRGAKMVTEHNDPNVVRSMVELAEAKGWSKLKVAGHDDFKREVWLQAALKDIDVTGFRPNQVDLAKLAELRGNRARNSIEPDVRLAPGSDKKEKVVQPGMRVPEVVGSDGTRTDAIERYAVENKLLPQDVKILRDYDKRAAAERATEPAKTEKPQLTGDYKVAAAVMADVLKEKGYSAKVLDKAAAEATKRLEMMKNGNQPAPGVKMFDKNAPREKAREQLLPSKSKQRQLERDR